MKKFLYIVSLFTLVLAVSAMASVPSDSDNKKSTAQTETVAVQERVVDGLTDQTVAPRAFLGY
jgi:hypothetical protein